MKKKQDMKVAEDLWEVTADGTPQGERDVPRSEKRNSELALGSKAI